LISTQDPGFKLAQGCPVAGLKAGVEEG